MVILLLTKIESIIKTPMEGVDSKGSITPKVEDLLYFEVWYAGTSCIIDVVFWDGVSVGCGVMVTKGQKFG